jgi:hypothetical protein
VGVEEHWGPVVKLAILYFFFVWASAWRRKPARSCCSFKVQQFHLTTWWLLCAVGALLSCGLVHWGTVEVISSLPRSLALWLSMGSKRAVGSDKKAMNLLNWATLKISSNGPSEGEVQVEIAGHSKMTSARQERMEHTALG